MATNPMLVYVDTSVLVGLVLRDQYSEEAATLLNTSGVTAITGSWTKLELASAIARNAKHTGVPDEGSLREAEELFASDGGLVTLVDVAQADVEGVASGVIRRYQLRAMDAWHLSACAISFDTLAESGEVLGFATFDQEQALAARSLGWQTPLS